MYKVKIKAGAIENLTDARYFAAREVEWVGFSLQPGTGIPHQQVKSMLEWIDGVKIVGEFDFTPAEEIWNLHRELWFDAVQVGMFTELAELKRLTGITVIKEVVIEENTSRMSLEEHLLSFTPYCPYFLLNFEKAGVSWEMIRKGQPFDVHFLNKIIGQYQVILSFDFTPNNILEIVETLRPPCIHLRGGMEEKVGFKSFDQLDELFDLLEEI